MKNYIIIVEVEGERERWLRKLSANRDEAIAQAINIVDKEMENRGITDYRFVNIIDA